MTGRPPEAGQAVAVGDVVLPDHVAAVARDGRPVRMTDRARASVAAARRVVEAAIDRAVPIYGVTTGFGSMSGTTVSREEQTAIQPKILRSHAVKRSVELGVDQRRSHIRHATHCSDRPAGGAEMAQFDFWLQCEKIAHIT